MRAFRQRLARSDVGDDFRDAPDGFRVLLEMRGGFVQALAALGFNAVSVPRGLDLGRRIVGQRPLRQIENLIVFEFVGAL